MKSIRLGRRTGKIDFARDFVRYRTILLKPSGAAASEQFGRYTAIWPFGNQGVQPHIVADRASVSALADLASIRVHPFREDRFYEIWSSSGLYAIHNSMNREPVVILPSTLVMD